MTLGTKSVPTTGSAVDQAAWWLARQRSGPWSEAEAAEFATWLKGHPSHTAAWASYERMWSRLETVRDDPKILAIREQARRRAGRGQTVQRIRWAAQALAASILLGTAVWWSAAKLMAPIRVSMSTQAQSAGAPGLEPIRDASTDVGERSTLVLADGSKVTLNTASTVHADLSGSERRVTLMRGEAFFDVAKDASRPFIVLAGTRLVIAVGTAFDVRLQDRQVQVTLVEGKVRIVRATDSTSSGGDAAQGPRTAAVVLEAGSTLVGQDDGMDHIERIDSERATSWRSGKLVFDGERLEDVVAEMNRYSRQKLEIADPALEERRISGVFEPGDGVGFAKALEAYGIALSVRRTPARIVLESPPNPSQ